MTDDDLRTGVPVDRATAGIHGDSRHGAARPGRAARNYLSGTERRRLFVRVVPPALAMLLMAGWLEHLWSPPTAPAPAPIDTVLARGRSAAVIDDTVRIGAAMEPETNAAAQLEGSPPEEIDPVSSSATDAGLPAATDAGVPGASPAALARIRDDTLFRSDDEPAWSELCANLAAMPGWPPAALARRVTFADLHGQSRALRGRLVRFRGIVRRLVPIGPDGTAAPGRPRWQGWIEPEGGPATPIVVYFLRIPRDMPHGLTVAETVDVTGYFFKRWAYQASDAIRTAPLVLSLEPAWTPRQTASPGGHRWGGWGLLAMATLVLTTWLGLQVAARSPRPPPRPVTLSWEGLDRPREPPHPWAEPKPNKARDVAEPTR